MCCKVLPIRDGLQKTSHTLCVHCEEGRGCRIYPQRPDVCRAYYCGWRWIAPLPEDWRPDQSGILVDRVRFEAAAQNEIPAHYRRDVMIELLLLRESAIDAPHVAEVVAMFVAAGIPLFLGVCGPPGFQNPKVFLNEAVKPAVDARDADAIMSVVREARTVALAHKPEPIEPSP